MGKTGFDASSGWVPEIVYEEGGSKIPYIHVPEGVEDPCILFVFLSRQTGEMEPGDDGEEVPIVEMDLHQYADMASLKSRLSPATYDEVRVALGLLPLQEAVEKGKKITEGVRDSVTARTDADKRREEIVQSVRDGLRTRGASD
jgi:hypothetical protein